MTLNLNSIINAPVSASPLAAARSTFNQFLIVGNSHRLSTSTRLTMYEDTDDMLTDGFQTTDPEYKAALIYVGSIQSYFGSGSAYKLWIGEQGASETPLEAVTACRAASSAWYGCVVVSSGISDSDHTAIAAYIEAASPASFYAITTDAAAVFAGTADNAAELLKEAGYKRVIPMYSTDQGDDYPNNAYAIASIMAYAMGANDGTANSAYTLKFKELPGIHTEPLTAAQLAIITGNNCNAYVSYNDSYNWFVEGKMSNGWFFDRLINLDMLVSDIQLNVADLLNSNPKIPQTDAGIAQILRAINQACDDAVKRGYLGAGTWTGATVLNLSYGDPMPKGYVVQAESLDDQASADRDARISPNIYVCIKEAGSIHSLIIKVYVES